MKRTSQMLPSLFSYVDYKLYLRSRLEPADNAQRGQRALLARAIKCQPAYLSRVLNGSADLSLEQIEAACRFLVLVASESRYLMALHGCNRAGSTQVRAFWQEQMQAAKQEHQNLKQRLKLDESLGKSEQLTYYGSWHFAAVHMATSIKKLQTVSALSNYFALSTQVIQSTLEFLISVGLVKKEGHEFRITDKNIFLGRNEVMAAHHHLNWKLKSIETLNTPGSNQIHYTGVVTLSRTDAEKIKELILSSVMQVRDLIASSSEELLACYNFGFFEVGRSSIGII